MAYEAQGVTFDGTNDYLSGADTSGATDNKLFSCSFWIRMNVATGPDRVWDGNGRGEITYTASETFAIRGDNAGGTKILDLTTSVIADTNWHHVMASVDMADTGKRHLYVDDVSDITVNTYTDDTLDHSVSDNFIGISSALTNPLDGDLADFWIAPGQYIDLSVLANRRKFIGPNGGAVDLGSDGSTPTGTAPLFFLSGATATWHTNKGTAGGFTETGALTDAATNPPAEPDVALSRLALLGAG